MKDVEFWRWWLIHDVTGKRIKSNWRMTAEDALKLHGATERVEGSCEVRSVPESEDEHASTSGWQRPKR